MLFLIKELSSLIENHKVDILAYEQPFFRMGQKNAMPIYFCSGILEILSAKYEIPLYPYSATEVKKAVTGKGKADKDEVEAGVRKYLQLEESFLITDDHSSDSLAVGITCYNKLKK